jgi:hypothetical protein
VPPGGEEPPDSVSNPFLSRDFSYLIKMTKIKVEKFNVTFFLLELLPNRERTLQISAYAL